MLSQKIVTKHPVTERFVLVWAIFATNVVWEKGKVRICLFPFSQAFAEKRLKRLCGLWRGVLGKFPWIHVKHSGWNSGQFSPAWWKNFAHCLVSGFFNGKFLTKRAFWWKIFYRRGDLKKHSLRFGGQACCWNRPTRRKAGYWAVGACGRTWTPRQSLPHFSPNFHRLQSKT